MIARGHVEDGYEFQGGDPADPKNWVQQGLRRGQVVDGYAYMGGDPGVRENWAERPATPKRGFFRGVGDLGVEVASGVARGVGGIAGAFGAGNAVASGARAVDGFVRDYLSAQAKSDDQEASAIMAAAQDAGVWEQVKAAAQAFAMSPARMTANALGTSVPTIAATLIPGVGQAGAVARLGMLGSVGAAQGAGVVKGSIYEAVKAEQIKAGATEQEAEAAATQAQAYAGPNTGNIAAGAGLGAAASATGVQPVIAKMLRGDKVAAPVTQAGPIRSAIDAALRPEGLTARMAVGALKEAPLEGLQGGQEQFATNVALQREGFDVPAMRGVFGSAALEAMAASPAGAMVGAFDKPQAKAAPAPKDDPVPDILAAGSVDEAIQAAANAVAKRRPGEVKFNPDLQAKRDQLDPGLREQMAMRDFEAQARADQMMLRQAEPEPAPPAKVGPALVTAIPARIPAGETSELLPTGDAAEVESIPAGEAAELIPTPDAIEQPAKIPAPKATELAVETILADDILTGDNVPYGSKLAATVRARKEGLDVRNVVEIPGAGWVIRPSVTAAPQQSGAPIEARPAGTRGTNAGDVVKPTPKPEQATGNPMLDNPASWVIREKATGKVVMETFDRAKVNALNTAKYEAVPAAKYLGELNAKSRKQDEAAPAADVAPTPEPVTSTVDAAPAAPAIGTPVTIDGKAWTVDKITPAGVTLRSADGATTRMVAAGSKTHQKVMAAAAEAQPQAEPATAAPASAANEPPAGGVDAQIAAAEASGVVLSDGDKATIRELAAKAEDLNRRAGRISALGADPMRKGNAFPMGVGFTKMTKRAEQRIDASVRRAGESVDLWKRAESAERQLNAMLRGENTAADAAAKAAKRDEADRNFAKRLTTLKAGDKLAGMDVVRISRGKDGNPSSVTVTGKDIIKGVNDKIDVVRTMFGGDKAKYARLMDEARKAATPNAEAPVQAARGESPAAPVASAPPVQPQAQAGSPAEGAGSARPTLADPTPPQQAQAESAEPTAQATAQPEAAAPAADGRLTSSDDIAAGDTIRDAQGRQYRVHSSRHNLLTTHPIVNGKPQVSADTKVRFWLVQDSELMPPGENDRRDPVWRQDAPTAPAEAPKAEQEPAAQAAAILDAAADPPKGKERLDVLKDVKAGAVTPEEVAAAFPPAEPTEPTESAKINDAGEKIGGARKDLWRDRGLSVADLDAMSESEGATLATKANVWKPDYAAIAEASEPVTAAMVKVVYDQLAAQPKKDTPEGRRDYVKAMQAVRKVYGAVTTPDQAKNAYQALREEIGLRVRFGDGSGFREATGQAAIDAKRVLFSVYKGRSDPFVFGYNELARARKLVQEGFPGAVEPWTRRYVVRQFGGAGTTAQGLTIYVERTAEAGTPLTREQIAAGAFEVRSKTGGPVAYAATKADAEAAAKAVYERTKGSADAKEEPDRPHLDKVARENLPQRIDREVTPEILLQEFGFRGVEFGNWAAQDERRKVLALAYDALADLAAIVGVPNRALSLNGTMGLAFGARGGGKFAAHYEPGKLVINMTKLRGAGSLAHEWAHALDHYLGELGRADAYKGKARGASGWYSQDSYTGQPRQRMVQGADGKWTPTTEYRMANLRPELAAQVDAVMKRLYETPIPQEEALAIARKTVVDYRAMAERDQDPRTKAMYADGADKAQRIVDDLEAGKPSDRTKRSSFAAEAQRLSGKKSDGYWVRPTEMLARAFESYVFDRLMGMGAKSEYLVHGVEQDRYSDGTRYKGNPYPTGAERAAINDEFAKLFNTLKTRTDDATGNVALFSRTDGTQGDGDETAALRRPGRVSEPADGARLSAAPIGAQDQRAGGDGRTQPDRAAPGIGATTGMPPTQVRAAVEALTANWANAPRIEVVRTIDDPALPDIVRTESRAAEADGAVGAVEGVLADGVVYLVADRLRTDADVARVLFHESVGHFGLRGVFGEGIHKVLAQLDRARPDLVTAKAISYGMDPRTQYGRMVASEEVLAEIAQSRPTSTWVQRAIAAIRTWLREHVPSLDLGPMSRDEIVRNFITPARLWVERGQGAGKSSKPLFSRAPERRGTAADAIAAGFTMKAYRGVSASEPFNDTGTTWLTTSREVAEAYAEEVMGYDDPAVLEVMVKPDGLPRHDASRLDEDQRAALGADEFGNPQAVGIYDRSDDHPLGGSRRNVTVIHAPKDAVWMVDDQPAPNSGGAMFSRTPQTETEAFKRWFGASVVTEDGKPGGKPLVVYHGSPDARFVKPGEGDGVFRTKREVAFGKDSERAFFFAADQRVARTYADPRRAFDYQNAEEGLVPAFLSLQNPMVIDAKGAHWRDTAATMAAAREAGHDGVIIRNSRDTYMGRKEQRGVPVTDVFVAFRPEQIKSATGNAGTFDPTNPDIRFSRAAPLKSAAQLLDGAKAMKLPAQYLLGDFMQSHGKLSRWHKTVGTMHNLARRNADFKRVYDAANRFLGDVSLIATEAADMAPTMLPKLEGLKDFNKQPLSAEDTKAISAPIFEGTLIWTRDENGQPVRVSDPEATAGIVWEPAELRRKFKLDDRQIGLYQEFRSAVDESLRTLTIANMVRFAGKDAASVAEQAMSAPTVQDAASIIRDRLAEVAEAMPDRADVLADTAEKITAKANLAQDLMARGYAPLSRFGRYTVDVVDTDGNRVYFGMFESQAEANRMARKMRMNYPQATINQGTTSQREYQMYAGVNPETLELFGDMLGLESQGSDAADKAFQEYLKRAKSTRSAMKRLIHRKGIAGFSEDAGRVLAGFIVSNARQASKDLHYPDMIESVHSIAETKGQGELLDAAIELHQYVSNPTEEAQKLRGLLFAQFLGGSIASGLVNLSQTAMVTFPYLSQYGGATKAAKRMKDALADALAWETGRRKTTGDAQLDAALKKAEDEGIVSPQEVHYLMAQAGGGGALKSGDGTAAGNAAAKASNYASKIMLLWGKPFAIAEQFNRRSTFIAAYRTAQQEGIENPAQFAENAVTETQFAYTKANRPKWARGAIGSTLFTFKTYSISYVELLTRLAQSGPEGRRAAGLALFMLFLMSGLQGLPGADDLDDVIDALAQRLGYNWDTKERKREALAAMVGEDYAKFLMSGVSGLPGAPLDVSGRMGMGNLIPGTGLLMKKQDHGSDVAELLGPVGSLAKQVLTGADQLTSGRPAEALRSVLPVAAANAWKGAEMASMGMYRDQRGRKVIDTDMTDAFVKAIGFQPADVAKVQQATQIVQQRIALNKMREAEIADQWARGIFEGDRDEVAAAREAIREWNRDNPESRINITMSQVMRRVRQMRMSKSERIAKTAPREIRQQVRRELENVE